MTENSQLRKLRKSRRDKVIILSLVVIAVSQLNLNIFVDSFKVSVGAVCLPVIVFLMDRAPVLQVSAISAAGVFLSRVALRYITAGNTAGVVADYAPEAVSFLLFGILYYIYGSIVKWKFRMPHFIAVAALIDYLPNSLELVVRYGMNAFTADKQLVIILVALVRTAIVWVILTVLDRYRLILISRSHADRYRRLMVLISDMRGEMTLMEKNTELIESTMNTAYSLYQKLQDNDLASESNEALTVAKDVHEIKKEYNLIMRGISEALKNEAGEEGASVTEIFSILKGFFSSGNDSQTGSSGNAVISWSLEDPQLYTEDAYHFLSVFRNLVSNSVEAAEGRTVNISIEEKKAGGDYAFTVTDDGPGIDAAYRDKIFAPGFSTKIDFETGVVSRGLGLSIVRDIVEDGLGGSIELAGTAEGEGASFRITVPEERLERGV